MVYTQINVVVTEQNKASQGSAKYFREGVNNPAEDGNTIFMGFPVIYGSNDIIKLLVFITSTRVPAMPTGVWAFELKRKMEARLLQGDLPFIVVRPTFYMENLLGPWTMIPQGLRSRRGSNNFNLKVNNE